MSSGHRLAGGAPVRLAQLRDERWIAARAGDICHEWLLRVLPGVRPDFHLGEFETQLTLVAAGLGVAMLPRLARPVLPAGVRAAVTALRSAWDQAERSASRASATVNAPA